MQSGENMRQRALEAELMNRRRESRRFGMQGYSRNLHEAPNEGSLTLESSKLVVANVQNRPVLCHAEHMIDDDDVIATALQNLAASKRQKDRVPSAMILHRHLQKQNQFLPRQNSIVHQKIKGQNDLENDTFYVHVRPQEPKQEATLPNLNVKKAVASKFLQLFDLDSSRSGRTNEISGNYQDTSRRAEERVSTPVKGHFSWMHAPGQSGGYHMPLARLRSAKNSKGLESSPILELAAPYSKNYVENYISKVRHSRLGANKPHESVPKQLVRSEKTRNGMGAIEHNAVITRQRRQTAESVLCSSPSRGSQLSQENQDNVDDCVGEDRDEIVDFDAELPPLKDDDVPDPFERLERERMLEQVQQMYSDVSIQLEDLPDPALEIVEHFSTRNVSAATKSIHVIMPYNEERIAIAGYTKVKKEARHHERVPVLIRSTPPQPPLRMSVNILRPFENIVEIAEKSCAFPAYTMKRNQHHTPVAIMFGSPNLME